MLLQREDAELFYKLHCALMQFVNDQLKVASASSAAYMKLPAKNRYEVVQAFLGRLDLIDAFITANPERLTEEELGIVSSWRHLVAGRFIALRQLKQGMVLLPCDQSPTAYAVVGLVDPIESVISKPLPALIETVILPFRCRIIYDGIISSFNVSFGSGSRRGFEENFRKAKASGGFLFSLPGMTPANEARVPTPKQKRPRAPQKPVTAERDVLGEVVAMTDSFCRTRLNEEYATVCRKLAEKLAAKRPSPLLRGTLETWACGIVRTIGWVNFLGDRSQSPHMNLPEIDHAFGVAESTGQGKAKAIRTLLKIYQFDHRWTLPSRWESTSAIWLLCDSNGYLIDIRQQSVAMQRAAYQQGLIPFVPADRAAAAVQEQVAASTSRRLFQFKITLRGSHPPIWRRIQVLDDTFDRLHEYIQIAMGWTNSHLHEFMIGGQRCGDPELLHGEEPVVGIDSTKTLISAVMPKDGTPLSFEYRYDFGDNWVHDVLLEGCPPAQPGATYPLCLEGERACPPEDVGGLAGYEIYLEALNDPNHKQHKELLNWRGSFKPEAFNARLVTHVMQEGMPDWRRKE